MGGHIRVARILPTSSHSHLALVKNMLFSKTIDDGQRVAVWSNNGKVTIVDGPKRIGTFMKRIEHLRKHDVVPESGETVVEMPHVSPTVVGRAGFFVVVVLGLSVWVVAQRRRAAREASNSKPLV